MNILFLVHCEEMFRNRFPDPLFALRLRKACKEKKYDRVISLCSYVMEPGLIPEIKDCSEIWDWAWGFEPEEFDEEEKRYVIPANGHEWTWIPPELRDKGFFRNARVYIGGGCESECLQDFLDIMDYLRVGYTKVRGYIYQ